MRKVDFILFLIFINISCSVLRKGEKIDNKISGVTVTEKVIESVVKQNITEHNFFVQKAEISISSKEGKRKVTGSIKFNTPDKFLISIRSRSGIEAVRIFISHDTILVNDRLNRKLYYGSNVYLRNRYQVTDSILPVLLGDYVSYNFMSLDQVKCEDRKLELNVVAGDRNIRYVIDCELNKVVLAFSGNKRGEEEIEIKYGDFIKAGNIIMPGKIEIRDLKGAAQIEIKIKKMEFPWNGNIEFIPGDRYELRRLL